MQKNKEKKFKFSYMKYYMVFCNLSNYTKKNL